MVATDSSMPFVKWLINAPSFWLFLNVDCKTINQHFCHPCICHPLFVFVCFLLQQCIPPFCVWSECFIHYSCCDLTQISTTSKNQIEYALTVLRFVRWRVYSVYTVHVPLIQKLRIQKLRSWYPVVVSSIEITFQYYLTAALATLHNLR